MRYRRSVHKMKMIRCRLHWFTLIFKVTLTPNGIIHLNNQLHAEVLNIYFNKSSTKNYIIKCFDWMTVACSITSLFSEQWKRFTVRILQPILFRIMNVVSFENMIRVGVTTYGRCICLTAVHNIAMDEHKRTFLHGTRRHLVFRIVTDSIVDQWFVGCFFRVADESEGKGIFIIQRRSVSVISFHLPSFQSFFVRPNREP